MQITFTRTGDRTYSTEALRDDGVRIEVTSYDRTFTMPHDLAHYLVEGDLRLQRGFWGCVAEGAMFSSIRVISGRRRPHASERSRAILREAREQNTEAEVLVGVLLRIMHEGLENDWPAAHRLLSREWTPRKPSRGPLEPEEVQRVCVALRKAESDWQALEVGQGITVSWPPGRRPGR